MTDGPPSPPRPARIPVSLLQRRGIEAEVLVPFIRRLERELGPERAHALARETVAEIAREQGAAVAEALGRSDLTGFREVRDSWGGAGGDLTIEPVRADARHLDFNVTRCRFAELYEQLGARDLGFVLSCARDFTLSEGYSPYLRLERSQTIMQGASFCDFRYTYAPAALGGDEMAEQPEDRTNDTPGTPEAREPQGRADGPAQEPRRPHIRRGIGAGFGIGDGANPAAKDVFAERVRQAAAAARAAAERRRPGAQQAAQQARERAGEAAEAARPHVERAARDAAEFARDHQDELKAAAARAARIAAHLVVPRRILDAVEEELHREESQQDAPRDAADGRPRTDAAAPPEDQTPGAEGERRP